MVFSQNDTYFGEKGMGETIRDNTVNYSMPIKFNQPTFKTTLPKPDRKETSDKSSEHQSEADSSSESEVSEDVEYEMDGFAENEADRSFEKEQDAKVDWFDELDTLKRQRVEQASNSEHSPSKQRE